MIGRFFHPGYREVVEQAVESEDDLRRLLRMAQDTVGDRGRPAVELNQDDGSALVVAATTDGSVILWIDSLGQSFHSVGDREIDGTLHFDYHGSYTEVPRADAVSTSVAEAVALQYFRAGTPAVDGAMFEPD